MIYEISGYLDLQNGTDDVCIYRILSQSLDRDPNGEDHRNQWHPIDNMNRTFKYFELPR